MDKEGEKMKIIKRVSFLAILIGALFSFNVFAMNDVVS